MEQFSRECLEIDEEVYDRASSNLPEPVAEAPMEKIYDRAAKLVKRTLDVEGVIVMDVFHCEVPEKVENEGNISIALHHGDPEKEQTSVPLTMTEYKELNAFFEEFPQGKISEGIIPQSFRPFLPVHIQYALSRFCFEFSITVLTDLFSCTDFQCRQASFCLALRLQYSKPSTKIPGRSRTVVLTGYWYVMNTIDP
jgi:hypothetical protein